MADVQIFTTIRCDPTLLQAPGRGYVHVGWNGNPSPFYMLDFHRDRMLNAALHWGWDAAVRILEGAGGLENLNVFLQTHVLEAANTPCSAKVLIDRDGILNVVRRPAGQVRLSTLFPSLLPVPSGQAMEESMGDTIPERDVRFEVLVDGQPTAKSEFTHFKTTHRPMYDAARERAGLLNYTDDKEVLLVNSDNGSIMEGSITTPYFWRNGRWVTPPIPENFKVSQGSGGNYGTTRRWALERHLVVEEDVHVASLIDGEEIWLSNGLKGFVHGKLKLH
ncbi:putative 4-amino-4-deoxychorismate protein [Astrocystis sublimbata]|nr:putative 4-amino-4-deoxychorismate protein [Astrocystis sublimbata]